MDGGKASMFFMAAVAGLSILLVTLITDLKSAVLYTTSSEKGENRLMQAATKKNRPARKLFSLIHKLCTFPSILSIITLAVIVDFFFEVNMLALLVTFYFFAASFVWTSKLFVIIREGQLDVIKN